MKKKRIMILVSVIILFMIGVVSLVLFLKKDKKTVSDMEKFSAEYHEVAKNNVFVYRNIDEIINILEKGTGIVYLGFPECKVFQILLYPKLFHHQNQRFLPFLKQ